VGAKDAATILTSAVHGIRSVVIRVGDPRGKVRVVLDPKVNAGGDLTAYAGHSVTLSDASKILVVIDLNKDGKLDVALLERAIKFGAFSERKGRLTDSEGRISDQ